MQANDLTDEAFIAALRRTRELRPSNIGATRYDLGAVLDGDLDSVRAMAWGDDQEWPPDYRPPMHGPVIPEQVILAKADSLIQRGVIDGCACGCRGDFTFPDDSIREARS